MITDNPSLIACTEVIEMPKKITVPEAAEIMGVTPMFLRMGLREGKFPFGVAIQGKRWAYYINAERFQAYMEAQDMKGKASE